MTAIAVRKYKDKIVILADSQTFTPLPNGTKIKDDRGHECQIIGVKDGFYQISYNGKSSCDMEYRIHFSSATPIEEIDILLKETFNDNK